MNTKNKENSDNMSYLPVAVGTRAMSESTFRSEARRNIALRTICYPWSGDAEDTRSWVMLGVACVASVVGAVCLSTPLATVAVVAAGPYVARSMVAAGRAVLDAFSQAVDVEVERLEQESKKVNDFDEEDVFEIEFFRTGE
jgi:hypothetical protein